MRLAIGLLCALACAPHPSPDGAATISLRKIGVQSFDPGQSIEVVSVAASTVGSTLHVQFTIEDHCEWPVVAGYRILSDTMDIGVIFEPGDPATAFRRPSPPVDIDQARVCTSPGIITVATYSGRVRMVTMPRIVRLWWGGAIIGQSTAIAAS